MERSVSFHWLLVLAVLLLLVHAPAGASGGREAIQAAPSAPVITVWYGSPQDFGALGNPQRQINILGHATDTSNLTYSLNGGPDIELAIERSSSAAVPSEATAIPQADQGPDSVRVRGPLGDPGPMGLDAAAALLVSPSPRLAQPGDFNAEINTADLRDGPNTVTLKANDGQATETVAVNYYAGNTWPQPYSIDWDSVADIRDVVQVVDGQWAKDGDSIRTMATGYDRIVALGDIGWDDFQVTVPVTIHSFPDPNAGGVGVVARWQGHFQIDNEQPGRGWWQIGAYGFYRNRDANNGGPKLAIYTGHYDILKDESGYRVPLNTPHYFKLRAQTKVPGESGFYSFKAWQVGTPEPESWVFEVQDAPPDEMFNGSVLLVAHEADASFGDVEILPVLDVDVQTVGSGSVLISPELTGASDAYLYGDTIELTATPAPGWVFSGWAGDASSCGYNPSCIITMDDDKSATAYFGAAHSLLTGFNLLAPNVETDPPTTAEMALDDIAAQGGDVRMLCRWLSMADNWECHVKGQPFNNYVLELGQGYAFLAEKDSNWRRTGPLPESTVSVDLDPIWTLLGLPKVPESFTAAELLQEATAQGGDCTEIQRWSNGSWEGYSSAMPGPGFDLTDDQGYFVKCANAITYTPGASASQVQAPSWPPASQPEVLAPVPDPVISDVQVTNRRDVALSITWRTDQPSTGWVEYGEKTALGQTAHDDRGEGAVSQVHHITLTGLTPETTYYFRVHSGETVDNNGGDLYQLTTKATELPPVPFLAYGQVLTPDKKPAVGALVRAWLVDEAGNEAEALSALVDGDGYWSLNLSSGMDLPVQECKGLQLRLEAVGLRGVEAELLQPACEVQPVATIELPAKSPTGETMELYLPLILRQAP